MLKKGTASEISLLVIMIGALVGGVSWIVGVGSFLYYWGNQQMVLSVSAWLGFKAFMVFLASGFVIIAIGVTIEGIRKWTQK